MGARNHPWRGAFAFAILAIAWIGGGCFWKDDGDPRPTEVPEPSPTAEATSPVSPPATPTQPPSTPDVIGAQELFREGRFGEARTAFLAVAGKSQDANERAEALVGAANSAFALNDSGEGFSALQDAVAGAPSGSHVAVRARYLLIRHLNDEGRSGEAATIFDAQPALAGGSPLEPYYRFEGGRATWSAEGTPIWDQLLADGSVSPALKTLIRRTEVEKQRDSGDTAGLVRALDALIADTADPGARFERANLAMASGDTAETGAQLRALVTESPSSSYASLALAELEGGGFAIDPGVAGLAYYRQGAYSKAVDILLPAVDEAGVAADVAFRAYYLGAAYEDLGNGDEAIHYYDVAAASGASSPYIHRAKYWAARVAEWASTPSDASARYAAIVRDGPPGEFTTESAFRAGYVLFEDGDGAGAIAVWDSLIAQSSPRLEYWRGRALLAEGNGGEAVKAYESAINLGPLDLYGLEAARELGRGTPFDVSYRKRDLSKPISWQAIEDWLRSLIGGSPQDAPPTAACELAKSGLNAAAVAEIWAEDAKGGTWRSFELMKEAKGCGLTSVAAQLAVSIRTQAGVASHEPPGDLLRVAYPLDYVAVLDTQSQKANIDPLFFASLVRQESLWDPGAGSVAGALGLTQVIPPTGEAIARDLGVADFVPAMLFLPALSLEFGAHYLGGELATYGNPLIALAAYNAGPVGAARWASSGAVNPADVVEEIDFSETKNYVTYIYEAYAHYQLAWGG
ncbi:MAG: transglycosylase SLT domain-containing protein [Dehalococcoidia bacterium]